MFLSYRNQSIGLQSQFIDWFLYDRNIGRFWFKNKRLIYLIGEEKSKKSSYVNWLQ